MEQAAGTGSLHHTYFGRQDDHDPLGTLVGNERVQRGGSGKGDPPIVRVLPPTWQYRLPEVGFAIAPEGL